jgi:DNA mismatch endonuclease, patch repair protein
MYPFRQTYAVSERSVEPSRVRPGRDLSERMSRLARRHTAPELALRRELHRRGLRYRVQLRMPMNRRRTIDIAFTRARLAVFVDGCFWHGCPEHGVQPQTNEDWWRWKIDRNQARDADTTQLLESAGWEVLRLWEHEDPVESAAAVEAAWRKRVERLTGQRRAD